LSGVSWNDNRPPEGRSPLRRHRPDAEFDIGICSAEKVLINDTFKETIMQLIHLHLSRSG
jgi:hypothetical protein